MKKYFNNKVGTSLNFDRALDDIGNTLRISNVALGCWCSPKRCHAETIIKHIKLEGKV